MLILLFFVLLVTTFAVVLLMTRPTKQQTDLERRLAGFDRSSAVAQVAETGILRSENYSDYPAIDAMLQKIKAVASLQVLIQQAGLKWTVGPLLLGSISSAIAVAVLASMLLRNLPAGTLLGIAAGCTPYIYLLVKRRSRLSRFSTILPDAIDLLARALRAGHAVTAAIEMVSKEIQDPVGTEFRRVFEEQNFGLPLREALINFAKRVPIPDLQFMVTAMLVQKETGGNLAEILDKAGAVIRERTRLRGQLRIYTAQGRLTGWILGLLPFIIMALMNLVNPGYAHTLIDDPMGRKAILIGLSMMVVGVWTIHKIVDIKV